MGKGADVEKDMLDYLQIPPMERIVFEHTPLVLAICQIRFKPVLSISDPTYVAAFQRALVDHYPILDPFGEVKVRMEGLPTQVQVEQGTPAHRWKFTDPDDTWTIVLALDFISLETRAYADFDEFSTRLHEALSALRRSFPQAVGTRIGLRYINEIRTADHGWDDAIRPALQGSLAEPEFSEHVDQAIQQVVLKFEGNQGINVRHGLLEGTAVQPRPGEDPPTSRFYLLDYDAYREYPRPGSLLLDPEVIGEQVGILHEAISRLFRWSITKEYTSSLGIRHND